MPRLRGFELHSRWVPLTRYALLTKREIRLAEYWPSFFVCLFVYAETKSKSIKAQKKNEALNTQTY